MVDEETPLSPTEIRSAENYLLERIAWMRSFGVTFNGKRDMWEILGYPDVITPHKYYARYKRGGLARRIIDCYPKATWRYGVELIEDEDSVEMTEFEQAWEDLQRRLNLVSILERADRLALINRFSVMFLGVAGTSTLDRPVEIGRPENLVYVQPFSEITASITEWDNDVRSPRFGLPTMYQLKKANVTSGMGTGVHWTRIIHISPDILEDEIYSAPRLEACWNLLDDLDKVSGGGSEAFWLRANQGLQLDIDKDMALKEANATLDKLKEDADAYQHGLRRFMRTRGVTVTPLGSDVANFSNPADAIVSQIAGTVGIPKRILLGSEMGQLASEQDRDNWADQVNDRRTTVAEPRILRPFVDRCIQFGWLPQPEDYDVRWSTKVGMTETDKANGAEKWASINQKNGSTVFSADEIRDYWYQMEPLIEEEDDDEILLRDRVIEPLDEDDDSKDALPRAAAGKKSKLKLIGRSQVFGNW